MKKNNRNVIISGTGSYAPEKIYTNKYLEQIVDTNDEWIYKNLGIKERRIASKDQCTSDLAMIAGQRAIDDAKISKENIDLIIVATATPDRLAPSTACFVQDKLNIYRAAAFDISAVCSGFLYAMSIGHQFIANYTYDNILIIGADTFSKITNWKKRDCVFFGDGAGAALLSSYNGNNRGFRSFELHADGRGKYNFTIPGGGSEHPADENTIQKEMHYFEMNGSEVYNTGTKVLPEVINKILNDQEMIIDDIDYLIPHQPSIAILKKTSKIIGLPFDKVLTNMDRYANTSGATIPILLDESNKNGLLKKGNNILFAAVGSGWTWGASLLKW